MRRVLLVTAGIVAAAALAEVRTRATAPPPPVAVAPPAPEADPTYWPTVDGTPCGDRLPDR